MEYYIGLDMGTSSLGWAVTDTEYNLMRTKGKDMWGVRLFDEASSAAERRSYRTSRRNLARKKARIGCLKEYFEEAINEVDPGFYQRLNDSFFFISEKAESNKQKYSIFADKDYTDKEYFQQYPTIYHLREELLHSTQPHDVRLVYLAIANLFKRRGHFLNGSLGTEGGSKQFDNAYQAFLNALSDADVDWPMNVSFKLLEDEFSDKKKSRRGRAEYVAGVLKIEKKNKQKYRLVELLCGLDIKIRDLFPIQEDEDKEETVTKIGFQGTEFDQVEESLREMLSEEQFEIILTAKEVYDYILLKNIMQGYEYLSEARVGLYNQHKEDLTQLKRVLKKYDVKAYDRMFRVMNDGNYSAYVGSVNSHQEKARRKKGGYRRDEFYKTVKKILKNLPEDDPDVQEIYTKIEQGLFMPKQLTSDNGVIPNQLHARELKVILENAKNYLSFLNKVDDSGLTVAERIFQLFTFRIPYYIGPLGQEFSGKKGFNVWAKRVEPGRVFPWNLKDKIDVKDAAEQFIQRMVRHCTYLNDEATLPRQSLLYEKFTVLNELNNLRVYGEKLLVEDKQKMYEDLFSSGKKVSAKRLQNYLISQGLIKEGDADQISGIDGGFKNSLSSFGKFRGVFGEKVSHYKYQKVIENIIFWGTVYGNDKSFLKEKITETYSDFLDEKQIKRILGFKFEGWGKLSREFLEMEGVSKTDGVIRPLITAMWESQDNLMELLAKDKYTYSEVLDEKIQKAEKTLSEWTYDDLDGMYLSVPVKRMIWQTLRVMKEIEATLGCDPKRIIVEVTREREKNPSRKASRKSKLLSLLRSDEKEWRTAIENHSEQDFRIKKLYLYYMQMGRCMYTGEVIRLDNLMNDNLYDIDHIYPRHFVKDDSIENNLVLVKKESNAYKTDKYPLEESIRKQMISMWRMLKDRGFITEEKFLRLTRRTRFTDEEKAGFINRQLVETGQGTKAVSGILSGAFPYTEIIYSKAGNVSDFRHKFDLVKVRCVNDLHHAYDAYLNVVVGNAFHVKFTNNPLRFIERRDGRPEEEYKYHMEKLFEYTIRNKGEIAWNVDKNNSTIAIVKKMLKKNSPIVTKLAYENHGGITGKATIWSAKETSEQVYIPVKQQDKRFENVKKYGGFTAVSTAGYVLIEYQKKGKIVRSLEAVPVFLGRIDTVSTEVLTSYLESHIKDADSVIRVVRKFIPMNSLVQIDGYRYYLGGKSENRIIVKGAVQPFFTSGEMKYIAKIEKAVEKGFFEEIKKGTGERVITKERNEILYETIRKKYREGVFSKRKGAISSIIEKREDNYKKLSVSDQCIVLMALIKNMKSMESVDLKLIGESAKAGTFKVSKTISNMSEFMLINKSPAGLYEYKENLLKI